MKKKQKEEIRSKSAAELKKEIESKEAEILRLQMEIKTGRIKNTSLPKVKTDELAVIKTILRENELSQPQKIK